jgi:hypothetical protein
MLTYTHPQVKSGPASRGLDLVSYLIMPVQRLPRYVLLLSQLLELTDETHSGTRLLLVCLLLFVKSVV